MVRKSKPGTPRTVTLSFCASEEDADVIKRAGNRSGSVSATIHQLICPRRLRALKERVARQLKSS